jgi:hypothetical protein
MSGKKQRDVCDLYKPRLRVRRVMRYLGREDLIQPFTELPSMRQNDECGIKIVRKEGARELRRTVSKLWLHLNGSVSSILIEGRRGKRNSPSAVIE